MSRINFGVNYEGLIINVSYDASITARDFILDFTSKHTSQSSIDSTLYTFKYGGRILNSPKFLDKKLQDLIKNNSVVYFTRKKELQYSGGGIITVDVSKNITKEVEGGNTGLSYRAGCDGLCIRATCKNENCIAYNDTVYAKIGYVQNWNLFEHLEDSVLCPSCKELVNPDNYYFKNCYYRIDFIKNEAGKMIRGSVNGDASPDKYKYFFEKESGQALFSKLVFSVRKR
jgi:hypothetical protein